MAPDNQNEKEIIKERDTIREALSHILDCVENEELIYRNHEKKFSDTSNSHNVNSTRYSSFQKQSSMEEVHVSEIKINLRSKKSKEKKLLARSQSEKRHEFSRRKRFQGEEERDVGDKDPYSPPCRLLTTNKNHWQHQQQQTSFDDLHTNQEEKIFELEQQVELLNKKYNASKERTKEELEYLQLILENQNDELERAKILQHEKENTVKQMKRELLSREEDIEEITYQLSRRDREISELKEELAKQEKKLDTMKERARKSYKQIVNYEDNVKVKPNRKISFNDVISVHKFVAENSFDSSNEESNENHLTVPHSNSNVIQDSCKAECQVDPSQNNEGQSSEHILGDVRDVLGKVINEVEQSCCKDSATEDMKKVMDETISEQTSSPHSTTQYRPSTDHHPSLQRILPTINIQCDDINTVVNIPEENLTTNTEDNRLDQDPCTNTTKYQDSPTTIDRENPTTKGKDSPTTIDQDSPAMKALKLQLQSVKKENHKLTCQLNTKRVLLANIEKESDEKDNIIKTQLQQISNLKEQLKTAHKALVSLSSSTTKKKSIQQQLDAKGTKASSKQVLKKYKK